MQGPTLFLGCINDVARSIMPPLKPFAGDPIFSLVLHNVADQAILETDLGHTQL
jgi:hypothetical protein